LGTFGMAGLRIAGALFIGDDGHAENLTVNGAKRKPAKWRA
jgi:hypothetical protein